MRAKIRDAKRKINYTGDLQLEVLARCQWRFVVMKIYAHSRSHSQMERRDKIQYGSAT